MIEKIIELITAWWEWFTPCVVIDAYQGAVVLRWGVYHRSWGPGLHWKWPIAEVPLTETTCLTTMRMAPQTLVTKDDASVVVAAIVKYQIVDMEPYATQIFDQRDVLADVTMGAIRAAVGECTYEELRASPPERKVLELVRSEVNRFGFKIHKVTFTDLGRVLSLRLLGQPPRELDN